jgi:hypothetical protein
MALAKLPAAYIEEIRFSWESILEERAFKKLALVRMEDARKLGAAERLSLVPLTPGMAPRVHEVANNVATVLGCTEPYELFQTPSASDHNAQALLSAAPFAIRLIGPVVAILDDSALAAMIGHEFGHYLAHGPSRMESKHSGELGLAWRVAREITADRFGLLGCQDLDAAVRLEVACSMGFTPASLGLAERSYVEEVISLVETKRCVVTNWTHPSREFRVYAQSLFSRTTTYHRSLGRDGGELSLAEVDRTLIELLMTPSLERSLAAPDPVRDAPVKRKERRRTALEPPGSLEESPRAAPIQSRLDGLIQHATSAAKRLVAQRHAAKQEAVEPESRSEAFVDHEVEARFRELEAKQSGAHPVDEVETRFRELEKKEAAAPSADQDDEKR